MPLKNVVLKVHRKGSGEGTSSGGRLGNVEQSGDMAVVGDESNHGLQRGEEGGRGEETTKTEVKMTLQKPHQENTASQRTARSAIMM